MSQKKFLAELKELHSILSFVETHCVQRGFELKTIKEVLLSVEEAVVNIIHYGYPQKKGFIEIECHDCELKQGLTIHIQDEGIPFDPTLKKTQKKLQNTPEPIGGYGISCYTQLMDKVNYKRENGRNHLYLIKYLKIEV